MSLPVFVLLYLFEPGWIGVDLFFVLSGYLITGILLDTASRPNYYRNFIIRRALRILPLYYGFLLVCLAPLLNVPRSLLPWFFAYIGNIAMVTQAWPAFIGVLWSLQVEEQFYLTFPWIVKKAGRENLKNILLLAVVSALVFRILMQNAMPGNDGLTYFLMPARMDSLAMGGLVAIAVRERSALLENRAIPLLTILCGTGFVIAMLLNGKQTFGYTLIDLTFTGVLVLVITDRVKWLTALCRKSVLTGLGTISYCLYLIHGVILTGLVNVSAVLLKRPGGDLVVMTVALAISIAAAALSWRYIETPILRLKDRLAPSIRKAAMPELVAEAQASS
jgi:peptidoglycan/LPS O-acetylase OafA/YrhL